MPFSLSYFEIEMASEKWGKIFIFARSSNYKGKVQWRRKGGEEDG